MTKEDRRKGLDQLLLFFVSLFCFVFRRTIVFLVLFDDDDEVELHVLARRLAY